MRPYLVTLILAILAVPALAETKVELIGRFTWETEIIIGLSGIEVPEDGSGFLAVGDRGWWLEGDFERDARNDAITGVTIRRLEPIIGQNGFPVSARRVGDWSDAEGLALASDNTAYVSFERWAHVSRFKEPFARENWIKDHPTFYDHADNWQLEAAAIDPDGRLFVFSEKPLIEGFPIYRLGDNGLFVIDGYLPERDVFAIVGADFDEDGTLYILERKLVVGLWWQSRIRRVRIGTTLDETIWTSERGEFDNLEGLAVWRDQYGLRLTLVSDDNGSERLSTEFVEFRVIEE